MVEYAVEYVLLFSIVDYTVEYSLLYNPYCSTEYYNI